MYFQNKSKLQQQKQQQWFVDTNMNGNKKDCYFVRKEFDISFYNLFTFYN